MGVSVSAGRSWWRMSYERDITPALEAEFPDACRIWREKGTIVWPHVFVSWKGKLHVEDMGCWGDNHRRDCQCHVWNGKQWEPWLTK
jgi:hypothetical protein